MEEEEKRSFDSENFRKKKKRKISDNVVAESNTCLAEAEEYYEDRHPEKNLFHKKTRIIEQATPEALILNLYYGSPSLLIKADEFAVNICV